MVVIDTDVILLTFAYQNDSRQFVNYTFLEQTKGIQRAITVYNLMEILGQMSFNLSPIQLDKWQTWLIEAYQFRVIYPATTTESPDLFFRQEIIDRPFAKMRAHRVAFLDSLIINLAERTEDVEYFVTWNAKHFKNKTHLTVLTPAEYINQR